MEARRGRVLALWPVTGLTCRAARGVRYETVRKVILCAVRLQPLRRAGPGETGRAGGNGSMARGVRDMLCGDGREWSSGAFQLPREPA